MQPATPNSVTTILIFILCFSVMLLAACSTDKGDAGSDGSAEVQASYDAVGVVKTITDTKNYINIDHEAIPGFMDAMAMFFPVADTAILRGVAVNDSIRFTIEVQNDKFGVSGIEVIPPSASQNESGPEN